jgi:hypothetical protein
MTYVQDVETESVSFGRKRADGTFDTVMQMHLDRNNVKSEEPQISRVHMAWKGDHPAEIEIEPGPNCVKPEGSSIISQVMLWGKATEDGKNRARVTLQLNVDPFGGQYALLDSTTNDPSMSAGQQLSIPILLNAGEGKGIYVGLYPAGDGGENRLFIADRADPLKPVEMLVPVSAFVNALKIVLGL